MSDEDIESRLAALAPRWRTAFAAGCAERVSKIFDYNAPDPTTEAPQDAIKMAWSFAIGPTISARKREQVSEAIERAIPSVDELGSQYTSSMNAALAAAYALDSISDETAHCAGMAAKSALDAVNSFDAYRGDGLAEEQQWQLKWLGLIESLGQQPVTYEHFDQVSDRTPGWLLEWEE